MRKNVAKFAVLGLLMGTVIVEHPAYSWDDEVTHPTLTEIAVMRSRLANDAGLLPSIGLESFGSNTIGDEYGGIDPQGIVGLMRQGAIDEDSGINVLHHFFDPQNNRGLTIGAEYESSPDWILADNTSTSGNAEYSYRVARNLYLSALTSTTKAQREQDFAHMFVALGHVLHHVQDMGQPQHSRNDTHCNAQVCDNFIDPLTGQSMYKPSRLEDYTARDAQQDRLLSGSIPTSTYPIQAPIFLEPRDYWISSNNPGAGMAEFTSSNFITENDDLLFSPGQGVFDVATLLLPLPSGSAFTLAPSTCSLSGSQGTKTAVCNVAEGSAYDPVTGVTNAFRVARRTSAYDYIYQFAVSTGTQNGFYGGMYKLDFSVFDNMYVSLMPRITAFGAGLVDYFFRGSIDLVFNSSGTSWTIKNTGSETMVGDFFLYSDNGSGSRTQVLTDGWDQGFSLTLAPGASSASIPFTRPADNNGDFMLVFIGDLGEEGKGSQDAVVAVAGRKITLPKLTITYGDNGPALDDRFRLTVEDWRTSPTSLLYSVGQTAPARTTTVEFEVTPGYPFYISLDEWISIGSADFGATYFIEFSDNVQLDYNCHSLGGPFPLSGTFDSNDPVRRWCATISEQ